MWPRARTAGGDGGAILRSDSALRGGAATGSRDQDRQPVRWLSAWCSQALRALRGCAAARQRGCEGAETSSAATVVTGFCSVLREPVRLPGEGAWALHSRARWGRKKSFQAAPGRLSRVAVSTLLRRPKRGGDDPQQRGLRVASTCAAVRRRGRVARGHVGVESDRGSAGSTTICVAALQLSTRRHDARNRVDNRTPTFQGKRMPLSTHHLAKSFRLGVLTDVLSHPFPLITSADVTSIRR